MKAKDYFRKYGTQLQNPEKCDAALVPLIRDFLDETLLLIEQRKNKRGTLSDKALFAVIEETNNKWNALASMLPDIIRRNGLKDYLMFALIECPKIGGDES